MRPYNHMLTITAGNGNAATVEYSWILKEYIITCTAHGAYPRTASAPFEVSALRVAAAFIGTGTIHNWIEV